MEIGQKIKHLRTENDYTLKQLAEKTGLSISFISDIENGRRNPSLDNLDKLSRALGVPVDILLKNPKGIANKTSPDKKDQDLISDPRIRAIARKMSNLPSNQIELLQKLVGAMAEEARKDVKKNK